MYRATKFLDRLATPIEAGAMGIIAQLIEEEHPDNSVVMNTLTDGTTKLNFMYIKVGTMFPKIYKITVEDISPNA